MVIEPRSVSDYIKNFNVALADYFNTEDPGRTEHYHLIGDYVIPHTKRSIMLYVAHSPLASARKITRVYYVLPVNASHAPMFDKTGLIPSEGPLLHTFDVPAEYPTASAFVEAIVADSATGPANRRFTSWDTEIERVKRIAETPGETFLNRRTATKLVQFWSPLRESIMKVLKHVKIILPGATAAPWRHHSASSSRTSSPTNMPAALARSSSGSRRRRSSERRRRATRRKSTSDPVNLNPLGYVRDPVTGKLMRRRQPNSDPKNN